MKDSSNTKQEMIAQVSVLKKRIEELEKSQRIAEAGNWKLDITERKRAEVTLASALPF
jgi:hypothetical protein